MAADGFARLGQQKATGETEKNALIMFESMIQQAAKRGIELQEDRMVSNGALMIFAGNDFPISDLDACNANSRRGTGTTALSLTTAIYHLVARPALWKELQALLLERFGSDAQPDVVELEKLPLFEGMIKEALRVGAPARGRHPRVVPAGGWTYQGHFLPEGVCVSFIDEQLNLVLTSAGQRQSLRRRPCFTSTTQPSFRILWISTRRAGSCQTPRKCNVTLVIAKSISPCILPHTVLESFHD